MTTDDEDDSRWDAELTSKERLYVLNYCCNEETFFNATRSYMTACSRKDMNMDPDTAAVGSHRFMKKERVKRAIRRLLEMQRPELDERNAHKILHDIMMLAEFNPGDILDENGALKSSLGQLGDKAKAIEQIIPPTEKAPARIILAKRDRYVDFAMKYLRLVKPEAQIEVTLPVIEMPSKTSGPEAADEWNRISQEENYGNV